MGKSLNQMIEAVDIPLGEESERYEVEIYSGLTLKRTIATTSPTASYSAAEQITDFGSTQSSVSVKVYQLSAVVGRGYWIMKAPRGYKMQKRPGHGKVMVRDEPVASIIQEGLEGFALDRFSSPVELQAFFEYQPDFPRDRKADDLMLVEGGVWQVSILPVPHTGLCALWKVDQTG